MDYELENRLIENPLLFLRKPWATVSITQNCQDEKQILLFQYLIFQHHELNWTEAFTGGVL